jgi:hypothetical protein
MAIFIRHYPPMANGGETARLLARTEVFGDLEERELVEVAQVAVPRHWDRGEVIFREGDPPGAPASTAPRRRGKRRRRGGCAG